MAVISILGVSSAISAFTYTIPVSDQCLTVKGNHFIDSVTDERFVIVGIAYQPKGESGYDFRSGRDTLTDAKACLRDAILMQKLGINTIRVYNLNPYLNHDDCVSIFNSAGIYMALDVNSPFPGESINRYNPSASYTEKYLTRITAMVDAFKNYPNLLLFFAGNEVVNDARSAKVSPPYLRSVQRDLKNYIRLNANRTIPVGYSASDDRLRRTIHRYLTCGEEEDSKADFFGLNSYEWCDGANWETSGYQKLVDTFDNSPVPIFLSEYGCNVHRPRTFTEIPVLYGEKMADNWSGGIIYEYSEERSQYGLVQIQPNGEVHLGKEFDSLQNQYRNLNFRRVNKYEPAFRQSSPCDPQTIIDVGATEYKFNASFVLPVVQTPHLLPNNYTYNYKVPKGKLVDLPDTKSPCRVFSSKGTEIQDLQLKVIQDNNQNKPISNNSSKKGLFNAAKESKGEATKFLPDPSLGIMLVMAYLIFF